MSDPQPSRRGAAAVGLLADLPPFEAGAVRYFRYWFSGGAARADLHQAFCNSLGPTRARAAFDCFGALCEFCVTHGRRPLMRHGMSCSCLGADENCFANLLAAAIEGEATDADLLATLLVAPQQAQKLSALAAQSGLFLQQITGGMAPRRSYRPGSATLH
ncbi:hypothetical protein [Pseudophaeobacter sp.]|uniref:hypothetical protein n=1 Tax=Pseudophaeobacter sp. TaxID=1971739 RepID=UPI0032975911